jgi:uncharacterized membrane protein
MEKPKEIIIESPEYKKKKLNRVLLIILGLLLTVFVWVSIGYVFRLVAMVLKLVVVIGIVFLIFRYFTKRKAH